MARPRPARGSARPAHEGCGAAACQDRPDPRTGTRWRRGPGGAAARPARTHPSRATARRMRAAAAMCLRRRPREPAPRSEPRLELSLERRLARRPARRPERRLALLGRCLCANALFPAAPAPHLRRQNAARWRRWLAPPPRDRNRRHTRRRLDQAALAAGSLAARCADPLDRARGSNRRASARAAWSASLRRRRLKNRAQDRSDFGTVSRRRRQNDPRQLSD